MDLSDNEIVNETDYVNKDKVTGSSFNVGDSVTYNGAPCIVSEGVDSDGDYCLKMLNLAGIFALCDAVKGNTKMTTLNLAKNGLGQSAKRVAEILPTMT